VKCSLLKCGLANSFLFSLRSNISTLKTHFGVMPTLLGNFSHACASHFVTFFLFLSTFLVFGTRVFP